MPTPPEWPASVGECITVCFRFDIVIRISSGLNSYDKTDKEGIFTSPTDDLIRFWRSKVIVTLWFKYVMAKTSTSTLGR